MRCHSLLGTLASTLCASALAAQTAPAPPRDTLALARQYTAWLYAGEADSLVAHADSATRATTGIKDQYAQALFEFATRAGQETSVVEERFVKRLGHTQYWRTAKFSTFTQEPLQVRVAVNDRWEIIGLGFNPLSQAPPVDPK
jgi:hypothetical protein